MPTSPTGPRSALWQLWLGLGAGLLLVAWLLPANVKSLNPALLREAGRDTPTLAGFGRDLLELDKPGPAALVLEATRKIQDPAANSFGALYDAYAQKHRDLMPWGGWDVALEPLLANRNAASPSDSQPVLRFMVTQQARENLRRYLAVSRLPGVQTLLKTATLTSTQRLLSSRELMSKLNPWPLGSLPVTQIDASADRITNSRRPSAPGGAWG